MKLTVFWEDFVVYATTFIFYETCTNANNRSDCPEDTFREFTICDPS